jgi:hypothetical protein
MQFSLLRMRKDVDPVIANPFYSSGCALAQDFYFIGLHLPAAGASNRLDLRVLY